jgi:hypothetical protein
MSTMPRKHRRPLHFFATLDQSDGESLRERALPPQAAEPVVGLVVIRQHWMPRTRRRGQCCIWEDDGCRGMARQVLQPLDARYLDDKRSD